MSCTRYRTARAVRVCRKNERSCRHSRHIFLIPRRFSGTGAAGTQIVADDDMNKPLKTAARSQLTLGDLIVAISSCSRNSREATLAIADLLHSGRVVVGHRRSYRRGH